jgi:hypothetical protein
LETVPRLPKHFNNDKHEQECARCNEWKSYNDFPDDTHKKNGKYSLCYTCKWWRYRERNFNTTQEALMQLWEQQKGICPICLQPLAELYDVSNHIDHDHVTGRVRGWVHWRCNNFLTGLEQRLHNLAGILSYLRA